MDQLASHGLFDVTVEAQVGAHIPAPLAVLLLLLLVLLSNPPPALPSLPPALLLFNITVGGSKLADSACVAAAACIAAAAAAAAAAVLGGPACACHDSPFAPRNRATHGLTTTTQTRTLPWRWEPRFRRCVHSARPASRAFAGRDGGSGRRAAGATPRPAPPAWWHSPRAPRAAAGARLPCAATDPPTAPHHLPAAGAGRSQGHPPLWRLHGPP